MCWCAVKKTTHSHTHVACNRNCIIFKVTGSHVHCKSSNRPISEMVSRQRRCYCRPLVGSGLSSSAVFHDLEWPSRSFIYCKRFDMRFLVGYSCAVFDKILPDTERRAVPRRQRSFWLTFCIVLQMSQCNPVTPCSGTMPQRRMCLSRIICMDESWC